MNHRLTELVRDGVLTAAERHALTRLITLSGTVISDPALTMLARAFRSARVGDVCVLLDDATAHALDAYPGVVTTPNAATTAPFLCDGNRLYLSRLYHQEQALGHALLERANTPIAVDEQWLATALTELFGPSDTTTVNRQRLATAASMTRQFTVISGGPGSGKTFTVAQILTLLNQWHDVHAVPPLQVVLAAPTGRAAARLTQTLHEQQVPVVTPAMTLHRLLHTRLGSTRRGEHRDPLRADVVIVDEASMVGLPLFATLVDALHPDARLILIGDSNQLGAIDTGAVFHELCATDDGDTLVMSHAAAAQYGRITGEPVPAVTSDATLGDVVVRLNVTHRFDDDSGVGMAARVLRDTTRTPDHTLAALGAITDDSFTLHTAAHAQAGEAVMADAIAAYTQAMRAVLDDNDPHRALELFERFRVLCAVHDGPNGTRRINRDIIDALGNSDAQFDHTDRFAVGRFVLVTRNDMHAGVQNGDVGVVVRNDTTGQPDVVFTHRGTDLVRVSPYRLEQPDDPYAMTVHKAQGSQFDTVAVWLPDRDTPVATRALVYTAVTRARTRAVVLDPNSQLAAMLGRREQRVSGLHARVFPHNRS